MRMARIRHRLSDLFWLSAIPLVCVSAIAYFGYSGVFGARGLIAWHETTVDLAVKKAQLDVARAQRARLEHRITLMHADALDPDLLEEVARGILYSSKPGEIAVPREQN